MNRVQFQPGLSMADFMDRYGSDAQCEAALVGLRWPKGFVCLSRWFLAMHLLTQAKKNVAALELKRHPGVCYKTAWLIKHKLMEVMRVREDTRVLDGRVELDDACLGGSSENKAPFVAAVQTTPDGKPQLVCLRQHPIRAAEVGRQSGRTIG